MTDSSTESAPQAIADEIFRPVIGIPAPRAAVAARDAEAMQRLRNPFAVSPDQTGNND
ncbi:hypothetical protein [Actinoplanes sp. HUAS TT8]|uniref:hypothetical protein n=1 Tax=Actinoplanes sp. HUAS TT8 TaxID=3447453 RepID=UPI003F5285FE